MFQACSTCGLPIYPEERVERGSHIACFVQADIDRVQQADATRVASEHFAAGASTYISWGKSMLHRTEDKSRTLCGMLVGPEPSEAAGSEVLNATRCPRCEGLRLR